MTTREGKALPVMLHRNPPMPDIGYSHITAYQLWQAVREAIDNHRPSTDHWDNHPSRYADGEEEAEGIYR